tara:strand:+ start:2560 stop:3459 length:900 start_codon:yes stop_codon:yes gene_type:complete
MTIEKYEALDILPSTTVLIIFAPFHKGNLVNRILSSHKEFYWEPEFSYLPYENTEYARSPLAWCERVDHYQHSRVPEGGNAHMSKKQKILLQYWHVPGGYFIQRLMPVYMERYFKAVNKNKLNFCILTHADTETAVYKLNKSNLRKLVIEPCEIALSRGQKYYNQRFVVDWYKEVNADFRLNIDKLVSHDYLSFESEYKRLTKFFNLSDNKNAVRDYILRYLERTDYADNYLWSIMNDDGTLNQPYYSKQHDKKSLFSDNYLEFESAYLKYHKGEHNLNTFRSHILGFKERKKYAQTQV